MVVSLNTSYYEKGNLQNNRKKIVYNYINKTFVTDILALIPVIFDFYVDYNSNSIILYISMVLNLLVYFKWVYLNQVFH